MTSGGFLSRLPAPLLPLAAALVPPLLARGALLLEHGGAVGWGDLLGGGSDLAVCLSFAALLMALGKKRPWLHATLVALWCLAHFATFQHVRELGSGLQVRHAKYLADPVFFRGFVLAPARPLLLAAMLLAALTLLGLWLRAGAARGRPLPYLGAGIVGLSLLLAAPADPDAEAWRRAHFLQENLEYLLRAAPAAAGEAHQEAETAFQQDLDGVPLLALPGRATNVLVIVMESVPATAIGTIAAAAGLPPRRLMPRLSEIAERNLTAVSFVLHQRQTNRAMYSLLCGDYPRLGYALAKSTEYLDGGTRRCLPAVLNEASYETVYLQGAPLAFMLKDAFMTSIGFDRVLGDQSFESPSARSAWGVDDGTLFRRALELIETMEARQQPWFLNVLTVGTHPPVTIPAEVRASSRASARSIAMDYLDETLTGLLDALRSRGILDRTLVVITADESRGMRSSDPFVRAASANWGPLVVALPEEQPLILSEPVGISDLALSIVDYLGLEPERTPFIGRSLFRSYATPRAVFFSDVFRRRTGAFDEAGFVHLCDEAASACNKYPVSPAARFRATGERTPSSGPETARIRAAVARTLGSDPGERRLYAVELLGNRSVSLLDVRRQRLMGGQNLHIPARSRLDFEIDVRLSGRQGRARLSHALLGRRGSKAFYRHELPELEVGQRLRLRYSYATLAAIDNLKCTMRVAEKSGDDLRLHFDRARLLVTPIGDPAWNRTSGLLAPAEVLVGDSRPAWRRLLGIASR